MSSNFNPATFQFTKGQSLVLVGPQGCGKTTIARLIADRFGASIELEYAIEGKTLLQCLADKPVNTAIIDFEFSNEFDRWAKKHTEIDSFFFRDPRNKKRLTVKMPNFIFCTGESNPIFDSSRRFFVVDLGKGK